MFTSRRKNKEALKPHNAVNDFNGTSPKPPTTQGAGGEGLYIMLAKHQTLIMQYIEEINNALEDAGHEDDGTKPPSHSQTITKLLMHLDSAVTTTQQCLTKDAFEKNAYLKAQLKDCERVMYANVALLVKWADFASRTTQYSMNNDYILFCITAFKDALNDIVKLVAENIGSSSHNHSLSTPNRARRVDQENPPGPGPGPGTSLGPSSSSSFNNFSTPGVPTRSVSAKRHQNNSRDSSHSDSGDSDTTKFEGYDKSEGDGYSARTLPRDMRYGTPPINRSNGAPFHSPERSVNNMVNGSDEKPPPIPIKKWKQKQLMGTAVGSAVGMSSPNSSPVHRPPQLVTAARGEVTPPVPQRPQHREYEHVSPRPPPVPMKKNSAASKISGSPVHSSHVASSLPSNLTGAPPLPPIRVDSIAGMRSLLENMQSDKRKEPHPLQTSNLAQLIDSYNKRVQVSNASNGDAPPIPPKRKTVMLYNQLIQVKNYTFDDSLIPSLNIPPPPLPPKKKQRQKQMAAAPIGSRETSPKANGGEKVKHNSVGSQDELELSSDELDEKVNYLEVEEVSAYLKFSREDDGTFTLRGGPLDALIAYAGSTSTEVKQYTEAFISTYYTFTTPDELITKLLVRLHHFYREQNAAVWHATVGLLVRVLQNLNAPLIKEAEITLIELVHTMLTDGTLKFAQLVRNAVLEKLNRNADKKEFIPLVEAMCDRSIKSHPTIKPLTDIDPVLLARQLTLMDSDYFFKVDVSEMLYWAKEHNDEKCPKLTMFTNHFNNVSQWAKTKILEKDMDWKKREKVMTYFVNVMKHLREQNNFNSYLSILSAIESAAVSRLDWSERILKGLEEPRALIDCRGSFKNYRQAFSQTKPPCIPYIGLYLQDLTFLEEQPSKLEDGSSINFVKRWKQFKSVDHIRFAQTKVYPPDTYHPDPSIMAVFESFKNLKTDDELWQRSLDIKPSNRQKATSGQ